MKKFTKQNLNILLIAVGLALGFIYLYLLKPNFEVFNTTYVKLIALFICVLPMLIGTWNMSNKVMVKNRALGTNIKIIIIFLLLIVLSPIIAGLFYSA